MKQVIQIVIALVIFSVLSCTRRPANIEEDDLVKKAHENHKQLDELRKQMRDFEEHKDPHIPSPVTPAPHDSAAIRAYAASLTHTDFSNKLVAHGEAVSGHPKILNTLRPSLEAVQSIIGKPDYIDISGGNYWWETAPGVVDGASIVIEKDGQKTTINVQGISEILAIWYDHSRRINQLRMSYGSTESETIGKTAGDYFLSLNFSFPH